MILVKSSIQRLIDIFVKRIERIQELNLEGIIELVPTYCALLLQYDAMLYSYAELCNIIEPTLEQTVTDNANELVTVVEIPTAYGGEFGPDLGFVASHNNLTEDEVVAIHSGTDYLVYMLGFIPGFPIWAAWIHALQRLVCPHQEH